MIVECPGCASRYDVSGRPPQTRARCRCGTVFTLPEPPTHAGSLACPHCGATVPPTSARCEYCSSVLAVRACPRCFAMILLGHKHCAACGSEVEVPAQATRDGAAIPRACPVCPGEQLEGRLVAGVCLDECPRCRGIFIDLATLERVLSERQRIPVAEALGRASPVNTPAARAAAGPIYRKCPDCATLMNRRNFGRSSGVIIDVCRAHGAWFDADELPRVIAFVADGGVERAQRQDIERQHEQIRQARISLQAQQHIHGGSMDAGQVSAIFDVPDFLVSIRDLLRR